MFSSPNPTVQDQCTNLKSKWKEVWNCSAMDLVTFLQRLTELKREIDCLSVAIRCCRDSFGLQLPGTLLSVIGSFMLFRESASFAEVNKNWNSIAATNLFQR